MIKTAKNPTPRLLKSPIAMKAVEKQIADGKTPMFSKSRRVQVSLSADTFDMVSAKADRSGVSMSGVIALIVDEYFYPAGHEPAPAEMDKLRAELREYRERIRAQQAERQIKQ